MNDYFLFIYMLINTNNPDSYPDCFEVFSLVLSKSSVFGGDYYSLFNSIWAFFSSLAFF